MICGGGFCTADDIAFSVRRRSTDLELVSLRRYATWRRSALNTPLNLPPAPSALAIVMALTPPWVPLRNDRIRPERSGVLGLQALEAISAVLAPDSDGTSRFASGDCTENSCNSVQCAAVSLLTLVFEPGAVQSNHVIAGI